MDGSKSMSDIEKIEEIIEKLQDIGPRPVGSAGLKKASSIVEDYFTKSGWDLYPLKYDCPTWDCDTSILVLGEKSIAHVPNPYSPSCDVEGEILMIASIDHLRSLTLDDAKDKIIFLYGDLTKENLFPQNFPFYQYEPHQEIYHHLTRIHPLAIIFASHKTLEPVPLSEDEDFHVPSVTVSALEGVRIIKSIEKKIKLIINSRLDKGTGTQVIARKEGSGDGKIIVSGHLDTMYSSPGAHDNASGVLCLLGIANLLEKPDMIHAIELVALTGHECFGKAEVPYFDVITKENELVAWINVDGVGHFVVPDKISFYNIGEKGKMEILNILGDTSCLEEGEQWFQGEHAHVARKNVPCIAISAGKSLDVHHTRHDTFDLLDASRISDISRIIANIILNHNFQSE
ncbi:MAG: M28 family metallopeptidase [Candidatus Hodarchaeota archaeon]